MCKFHLFPIPFHILNVEKFDCNTEKYSYFLDTFIFYILIFYAFKKNYERKKGEAEVQGRSIPVTVDYRLGSMVK